MKIGFAAAREQQWRVCVCARLTDHNKTDNVVIAAKNTKGHMFAFIYRFELNEPRLLMKAKI